MFDSSRERRVFHRGRSRDSGRHEAEGGVRQGIKSPFEFSIDVGDPSASGGVRSIKVTPKQVGTTEGRFFNIWAVDEKMEEIAYRTDKRPAPSFRLSSPDPDPAKLLNGAVQDGIVGGTLISLN